MKTSPPASHCQAHSRYTFDCHCDTKFLSLGSLCRRERKRYFLPVNKHLLWSTFTLLIFLLFNCSTLFSPPTTYLFHIHVSHFFSCSVGGIDENWEDCLQFKKPLGASLITWLLQEVQGTVLILFIVNCTLSGPYCLISFVSSFLIAQ